MRIRAIKPEFWTDARVGEWDARRALFYVGIWQVADDSGRLRLDARLIRAELDPFDTKFGGAEGVGELLEELVGLGRVLAYEVEGLRYGLVLHFSDHQVINRPTKSRLPAPPEGLREDPRSLTGGLLPKVSVEGKGREQGRDQGSGTREEVPVAAAPGPSVEDEILEAWNAMAEKAGLPRCLGSAKVRKTIRTRAKAAGWLDAFRAAIAHVGASDFHKGRNERGWRADLEHVLQDGRAEQLAAAGKAPRATSLGPLGAPGPNLNVIFAFHDDGTPIKRSDLQGLTRPKGCEWAPWEPEFSDPDAWHDYEAFLNRDGPKAVAELAKLCRSNRRPSKPRDPRAAPPPSPPGDFHEDDRAPWELP